MDRVGVGLPTVTWIEARSPFDAASMVLTPAPIDWVTCHHPSTPATVLVDLEPATAMSTVAPG